MVGIILVTKPPFLFPNAENVNSTVHSKLDHNFVYHDAKIVNWTNLIPAQFQYEPDAGDYYFIGAIIALSSAIFSASNNIVIAKIGKEIPITVQLFYIGFFGLLVAFLCVYMDENDRFFTSKTNEIPLSDIGVALGVGCIGKLLNLSLNLCTVTFKLALGLFGFFCTTRSLTMIPPSTVATLRTSQIFVAFIAQVLFATNFNSILMLRPHKFLYHIGHNFSSDSFNTRHCWSFVNIHLSFGHHIWKAAVHGYLWTLQKSFRRWPRRAWPRWHYCWRELKKHKII